MLPRRVRHGKKQPVLVFGILLKKRWIYKKIVLFYFTVLPSVTLCNFTLYFDLAFIYLECNDEGQTSHKVFKEINNINTKKVYYLIVL